MMGVMHYELDDEPWQYPPASSAGGGAIPIGSVLQNEVKGWPPLVQIGAGFDLVTNAQWFIDVATTTTKATAVPISGEAGLDAKFSDAIKCVTSTANAGWAQRYTYADEPRIKLGTKLSALVWVASTAGGVDCVVKLLNSDASQTVGTLVLTDGDWDLYSVNGHVCAGTYVDLQVTKTTAGTFYAGGSITVMVGSSAIALKPRGLRFRWLDPVTAVDFTGAADPATWTTVDLTSAASALAVKALINAFIYEQLSEYKLFIRRHDSAAGANDQSLVLYLDTAGTSVQNQVMALLDDAQIFEYYLDRTANTSNIDAGGLYLQGYEEWE
jgi:hypothetical protein